MKGFGLTQHRCLWFEFQVVPSWCRRTTWMKRTRWATASWSCTWGVCCPWGLQASWRTSWAVATNWPWTPVLWWSCTMRWVGGGMWGGGMGSGYKLTMNTSPMVEVHNEVGRGGTWGVGWVVATNWPWTPVLWWRCTVRWVGVGRGGWDG